MPAGKGVVEGGEIPYQPWAAAKKLENFTNRQTADPLGKCYFPGVPRIMYMEFPFQIFQTAEHVAMAFEWSQVHRLIYTTGKPALHEGFESWMGSSRGRWEGDTLVVEVTDHNDKTWFDMAGDFHSDALRLTERYTMLDADTIRYEATVEDPKVFTKAWKMSMPLVRQKNMDRVLEYQCQAEAEEANGEFERDPRTWYPQSGPVSPPTSTMTPGGALPELKTGANLHRTADGKVDLSGYYNPGGGGANYGLERHARDFLTPATRGVVIDPADGSLPYQPWARAEADQPGSCPTVVTTTPPHIVLWREFREGSIRPLLFKSFNRPDMWSCCLSEWLGVSFRWMDARTSRTTSACGKAIRLVAGKAIRW